MKLFTIQCDTFGTLHEQDPDKLKELRSKKYAIENNESHRSNEGKLDYFCTPVFTSYKRAAKYADSESDYWYYIVEFKLSNKKLEKFIQDDHYEKYLLLKKVHPLVYCPDLKKYKGCFKQ